MKIKAVLAVKRLFDQKVSIYEQIDAWAKEKDVPGYSFSKESYRLTGWGVVGWFPPRLAVNVGYIVWSEEDQKMIVEEDLGRVVAK